MEDPAKEVGIDEFKKLEVRVGTVIEVSRVPKTEKLYKVIVDLGEHGKKQTITAGQVCGPSFRGNATSCLCGREAFTSDY